LYRMRFWAQQVCRVHSKPATALAAGVLSVTISGLMTVSGADRFDSPDLQLPSGPLTFGMFTAHFGSDGTFTIEGRDWPPLKGVWKAEGLEIVLQTRERNSEKTADDCDGPGRYRAHMEGERLTLDLVSDSCTTRRMVLDRSTWRPSGQPDPIPER